VKINIHPDNKIIITDNSENLLYEDSISNFEADSGLTLESIPNGMTGRLYSQNEFDRKYNGFTNETSLEAWSQGDSIIANINSIVSAKVSRELPPTQTQEEQIKGAIKKAVAKGQKIVQDIAYLNITSGKTSAQISAMMTDSTNARIFALLSAGALATAKVEIQAIDETYFTISEKNAIIASIDAFLS
jgi:hypothetical protein